jgi:O-antigen/teichoic acid export membrane protein
MSDQRLAAGRVSRTPGADGSGRSPIAAVPAVPAVPVDAPPAPDASLGGSAMLRVGALSTGAFVVLGVSRLAHGSLLSHATGADTYGRIGSLIGITYVAALFLPAGLASAMTKYVAHSRGRVDGAGAFAVYTFLRRLSDVSAVLLGALAALIAGAVFPLSTGALLQVGLLTAVFSMYSVDKAALYGFDRVARYSRLEFAGSGLAIVATIGVVWSGSSLYLVPLIAGYAVVVIGSRLSLGGAFRRTGAGVEPGGQAAASVAPVGRREVLAFVGLAAIGAGSAAGLLQGAPALASRFTDARNVGFLVAAVTLVSPLYLLPRVLGMALFPAMSRARGGGAEHAVRRSADLSMRGTLVILAPVFAAALPLAGPVLALYGGPQYAEGAPELRLLLIATYASVVAIGPINALSSGTVREARYPVGFALFGCVIGLLLVAPLGRWFGGAGVAAAYLVATIVMSAGPMVVASRRLALRWTGSVARGVLVLAGAFALTAAADAFDVSSSSARWGLDTCAALVCGLAAAAVFAKDGKVLLADARRGAPDPAGGDTA